MSFVYTDNKQLKKEFREIASRENVSFTAISKRLGLSTPQQFNNKFNNKRVSFGDVAKFLDVVGYELQIDFVKK